MSTRLIKGRKNVHLAKIENQNNRQVTFSKCRNDVFKKANELAVMSGAEVGIIVCPQGRKPYSFGHPNVNDTINNILAKKGLHHHHRQELMTSMSSCSEKPILKNLTHQKREFNVNRHLLGTRDDYHLYHVRLNSLQDQLNFALKLKSKLKQMNKNVKSQQEWFKGPIEKMNYTEASMLKEVLEDLLLKVKNYGTERGYGYGNGKWKAE